jgi:hypothetical protein
LTENIETQPKNYAHIIDGKVVNVSVWDGKSPYTPDGELIEIPENIIAGIDFDYLDGEFVDNRPRLEIPGI